eukprot:15655_1
MDNAILDIRSLIICKSWPKFKCKNPKCKYAHPIGLCKRRNCNKSCGKSHPPHNILKGYFCSFGRNCRYNNKGCLAQHDCPYAKHRHCSNKNCIYDHSAPQLHQQRPEQKLYKMKDNNNNSNINIRNYTTKDLACILKRCNGNLCDNKYSHPNTKNFSDKKKYYCQFDAACLFYPNCFNNHMYKWKCDASPAQYVCQFWEKRSGCKSDANQCRMFHPNGKKAKQCNEMKSEEKDKYMNDNEYEDDEDLVQTDNENNNNDKKSEIEEDDSKLCIVCMDNERDHVLIPCGHIAVCKDCKDNYNQDGAECPICREKVKMVVKTYN